MSSGAAALLIALLGANPSRPPYDAGAAPASDAGEMDDGGVPGAGEGGADAEIIENLDLLDRLELLENFELFDPAPPREQTKGTAP